MGAAEQTNLLTMAWVTLQIQNEAWTYFEKFDDQDVSFCDCSSFALARARSVDYVFGFDSHFVLAGFELRPGVTD